MSSQPARERSAERGRSFLDAVEQAVIGAVLFDNTALGRINGLRPADFAIEDHRIIYQAQLDCLEDGGVADLTTVIDRLQRNGIGDKAKLAVYLVAIAQNTPSASNVARYAEIMRERAKRWALADLGTELQQRAASADLAELQRYAENGLAALRPGSSGARLLDWHSLCAKEPPERRWAIRGWIGFGHTTLLVGPGGIGKTLLAQQIGSALALGRTFIDDVPGPLRVLGWHCEDDADEMWRRQVAMARWYDTSLDSFANLFIEPRHGLDNELMTTDFGRPLFAPLLDELRQQAGDLRADVVILDNVAQLYGGAENDRHQVTVFLNRLAGVLPGKAILLLAHPARSPGSEFSGSSAWENVCRTRLYLGAKLPDYKSDPDEQPDADERFLARRKANYSPKDWRRFVYRNGVLVPDAVETQGGIVAHIREQAAERTVVDGLKRLQAMGLSGTDGATSPRFLPRLLLDYKLGESHAKSDLGAAMRRLMLTGKLRRAKVGAGSDRHPLFGLEVSE